jgi:hypothetical protein
MSIDESLVVNIALRVVVARLLLGALKDAGNAIGSISKPKKTPPSKAQDATAGDWFVLWASLSDSDKEEVQRIVEDEHLRRRAQDMDMWPTVWAVVSEETKNKVRAQWKAAGVRLANVSE